VDQLGDPGVFEGIFCAGSFFWLISKEARDEIFGVLRDGVPALVVEVELAESDLLHDFLVALAVEGRHTREQDVDNDTGGPDVALGRVVLVQDFGSDVVWGTKFLIKVLGWVVNKSSSKIDDLYLIELLVLLEKDVLWLEVSMDNVVLVAVVDARENLLDKQGSITFAKLSSLEDLIKKLATLADSNFIKLDSKKLKRVLVVLTR